MILDDNLLAAVNVHARWRARRMSPGLRLLLTENAALRATHQGERCYIIGNNFDQYLNRLFMQIAISDDGECFDRMYTLFEGPTTRRVPGRHKEDGYHYPNSIIDGEKLLVIYSVNKEDIEVGVVDTTSFR